MSDSSLELFIKEHAGDDLNRLLLSASRYPEVDIPFAVEQIAARRQIREKLPLWFANEKLIFPSKITAEQCSSEQTAHYKQRLIHGNFHVCDLTGGLGIDSFFFSQKAKQVTYLERYGNYCEAARHNFTLLGANNITVTEGDANHTDQLPDVDVFYIDPARRGESNKRVFALSDCEPNLPELLPELWKHAPKVIAKLSPMADIQQTLELLPQTTEIHVLSVKNECKELLFVMEHQLVENTPLIYCVNFTIGGEEEFFNFTLPEETSTQLRFSDAVQDYLYEPNASILKAGAFKCITRLGVDKLAVSSHLYTSEIQVNQFPGRIFEVEDVQPFNNRLCKEIGKSIPQANITVRNFPLSVDELRKRTKIADGGNVYLFATTLNKGDKVLIRCRKV